MKKMLMVVLAVMGLFFFNPTTDVYAQGGGGGGTLSDNQIIYVEGKWNFNLDVDFVTPPPWEKNESARVRAFILFGNTQIYNYGYDSYSITPIEIYSDKSLFHKIGEGTFQPGNEGMVFLSFTLYLKKRGTQEIEFRYFYAELYYSPTFIKGIARVTDPWEDEDGDGNWSAPIIGAGPLTLRR